MYSVDILYVGDATALKFDVINMEHLEEFLRKVDVTNVQVMNIISSRPKDNTRNPFNIPQPNQVPNPVYFESCETDMTDEAISEIEERQIIQAELVQMILREPGCEEDKLAQIKVVMS